MQHRRTLVAVVAVLALTASVAWSRTEVKRGINAFSVEQDVELGHEAAAEIEKEVPVLNDPELTAWLDHLGKNLAKHSMLPDVPYTFKWVDSSEINAFALPGGPIYVNRGILELAETESELASVVSHEIGHVAARHGTNQLTKQMLVTMPMLLLQGTVLKGEGGWKEELAKLGIGIGATSVLLKYGRQAETQADMLGVQQLHAAGYELEGAARFFNKMAELQKHEPSALEVFFSSHPPSGDREDRVKQEIGALGTLRYPLVSSPTFTAMKRRVASLPPGRTSLVPRATPTPTPDPRGQRLPTAERPTQRWVSPDRVYSLELPADWEVHAERDRASFAPRGGYDPRSGSMSQGLIVRRLEMPRDASRPSVDDALDMLLSELLRSNPQFEEQPEARWPTRLAEGAAARSVIRGRLRGEREDEVVGVLVTLLERSREGDVFLVFLTVAQDSAWQQLRSQFEETVFSLEYVLETRW